MRGLPRILLGWMALTLVASTGLGAAAEPFDYFRNSWNVIGLKDYKSGTRITPANKLLLSGGATAQIRYGLQQTSLSRKQTKTLLEGWLPVVQLTAMDGPVRYEFTLWATPLPDVKDWKGAFNGPQTDDENYLNWIRVRVTNTTPTRVEARVSIEQSGGRSGAEIINWSIAPNGSGEGVVRIPFVPVANALSYSKEDPKLWLDRTVTFWKGLLASGAQIEVPCRKSADALRAAHVCQLIAADHGVLHGGEGFYDEFYIRDGAYQLMELEEAGLGDAARTAADHYLKCQRPDGRFESQKDQFDANGQALWALWQYYRITGDREWLEKAYPQMRKATEWIKKARREAKPPLAGLLPAAPADGEFLWDGKHHIVGYDVWNLRGLLVTAAAAEVLGRTGEAQDLAREVAAYREAIEAAAKRTGLAHFPPSWEKDGTHWGNTETLWPTELFARNDPRVLATMEHARKTLGGGFVEGTIRWMGTHDAIHPYMSVYTTMASLIRGEHDQVVEDYYWYLLHATAAHAFPEGIFYKRRFAWSDTIPHGTGASNFAILLRHMLVHEAGEELHLLAGVPDEWLAEGKEIVVANAPTHFGTINLRTRGLAEGVRVELTAPTRKPAKRVVLHLPKSRPLVGALAAVELATRENQKTPYDFASLVATYEKHAPPLMGKPIEGLVELPLAQSIPQSRCEYIELTKLANTDPFTAPFGVAKPGKLLFSGLPTGDRGVGGVPFQILNPAKNQGRAMVVLHSSKAPQDRKWPTQVEIPVNQQGKRLFFLGNVHGWASHDEGKGEWGAVAEYVIHYADGKQQVVPLITGRTTDEWAAAPDAEEVYAGLRSDPWHLNVLGVTLRPVVVDRIVFRDLGTPAAPVLVAATIEKE